MVPRRSPARILDGGLGTAGLGAVELRGAMEIPRSSGDPGVMGARPGSPPASVAARSAGPAPGELAPQTAWPRTRKVDLGQFRGLRRLTCPASKNLVPGVQPMLE